MDFGHQLFTGGNTCCRILTIPNLKPLGAYGKLYSPLQGKGVLVQKKAELEAAPPAGKIEVLRHQKLSNLAI